MRHISKFLMLFIANYIAQTPVQAQTQITSCNTSFMDSGGDSANYLNNENSDWLICPDTLSEYLELEFTHVDIETAINQGADGTGCKDVLYIYDGIDDNAPIVGSYCGEESGTGKEAFIGENTLRVGDKFKPTNSAGCFYIQFQSDNIGTLSGWYANVNCCIPTLDNMVTDGIDLPIAVNRGNYFDLSIDNGCIRKGDLGMFSDFESTESSCHTQPNRSFYAFETNSTGGYVELLAEPVDRVGIIEMLVFGPVTLDSASYIGGVVNDCVTGETPWPLFFNSGPNQTYILAIATEFSGHISVKTLPSSVGVGGVLPVTIDNYNIKKNNLKATISWTTSSEINNDGFEIYRSFDGKVFSKIGWVDSQSSYNKGYSYSFIDTPERTGIIYYYLKQLDLNGLYKDLDVLKVNFDNTRHVFSFPNPSHGYITISTGIRSNDQSSTLKIYNQIGQLKLNTKVTNNETIDLSNLKSGIYTIQIITEGNTYSHQHIIDQ
jgi:hypothetical protein